MGKKLNKCYDSTIIEQYEQDENGVFQPVPGAEIIRYDSWWEEPNGGEQVQAPEKVNETEFTIGVVE